MMIKTKKKLNAFDLAAESYEQNIITQKQLFLGLIERLKVLFPDKAPQTILDVGCASGENSYHLAQTFPNSLILGLDRSPSMIALAKSRYQCPNLKFVCEDILEFTQQKPFSVIVANATLQWVQPLQNALDHLHRLLSPQGIVIGTLYGPETYWELAQVLGADTKLPAQSFADARNIQAAFNLYFGTVNIAQQKTILEFESLKTLLQHIKNTGTKGKAPFWTPQKFKITEESYRRQFGKILATHHLISFEGRKS